MKKHILFMSLLLASNLSHASANALSVHSRNNCGNNESVTWHGMKTYHLGTNSRHYSPTNQMHYFGSGITYTWRSAAVHWGEGVGGWRQVEGEHYLFQDGNTKLIWVKFTGVYDCSIYNGWWEWDYKG